MTLPRGDTRERLVCQNPECGYIHYENPHLVVACIIQEQNSIMLCKRAIGPRYGFWTLPGGFMENGETTMEGAAREAYEEAGARVEIVQLHSNISIPYINQVHQIYLGKMISPEFHCGDETQEVRFFNESDIPWDTIAFKVIKEGLKCYFSDRKKGVMGFHLGEINKQGDEHITTFY